MSFLNLTPERRAEIARLGQAALKASGKRHHWNSDTARAAAKKSHENKRAKREQSANI